VLCVGVWKGVYGGNCGVVAIVWNLWYGC
jgi:hypothetical protein